MQQKQGSTLTTLGNSREFLRANAQDLGVAVNEAAMAKIDEAYDGLAEHAATANGLVRAAAGSLNVQRLKRDALIRDHMAPIARIAALEIQKSPETIALTLPRKHATLPQLAALANGMAKAAAPYAAVFIAAGRKPEFIAELQAAAQEMLAAATDRAQNRFRVKQLGTDLHAQLARGRKVINMFDALVKSAAKDKPGLLAAWKMAKRVPKKGTATPAIPAPTPTTPTTPAVAAPQSTPATTVAA